MQRTDKSANANANANACFLSMVLPCVRTALETNRVGPATAVRQEFKHCLVSGRVGAGVRPCVTHGFEAV